MSFYSKPYLRLLKSNVSANAKLTYLILEGWFNYYQKQKRYKTCTVFLNQLSETLNIKESEVLSAIHELTKMGVIRSWCDKKSVKVGAMYTFEEASNLGD